MTKSLAVLVGGSLLLAAVLAPPIWVGLGAVTGSHPWPFSRVFDRVAIAALAGLAVALRKSLGLGRLREAWRAESRPRQGLALLAGLGLAILPALASLPLVVGSTRLGWAGRSLAAAAGALTLAIPAALVVAVLEESFFRVLVFRGLAGSWPVVAAAVASSLLYSCVHFLEPYKAFQPASASPAQGLAYLASVLARLGRVEVLPALLGLFLVGLVLCLTLHRTGSVALCVGLHAGYFAAVKVAILATTLGPAARGTGSAAKRLLLLGSPWVWLAVCLGGVGVLLIRWRR